MFGNLEIEKALGKSERMTELASGGPFTGPLYET